MHVCLFLYGKLCVIVEYVTLKGRGLKNIETVAKLTF